MVLTSDKEDYVNSKGWHKVKAASCGLSSYKRIIGDRLRAKKPEAQAREAKIGVLVLNRMLALGMPASKAVVAV